MHSVFVFLMLLICFPNFSSFSQNLTYFYPFYFKAEKNVQSS